MSEITETLAQFVLGASYDDMGPDVIQEAKWHVLDTIGVCLAGSAQEVGQIILQWVEDEPSRGIGSVLGTKLRVAPGQAALINGVFAHALDYDDSFYDLRRMRVHPSASQVAASLAIGEKVGASGKELLQAYTLGVEVIGKLANALGVSHFDRGWHATGTLGTMGATAVAGKLLGLSKQQLRRAFGMATSMASGCRQNVGTMTKPLHQGMAARNGVLAASLANHGFTANEAIFDSPMGFGRIFVADACDWNPTRVITGLGSPWAIIDPGLRIKRYPSCGGTHKVLDGCFALLRKAEIPPSLIEKVEIDVKVTVGGSTIYPRPKTGLEGKFSREYCVAAALLDQHIGISSFTDEMVLRQGAQELLRRVHVNEEIADGPEVAEIKIFCRDGSCHKTCIGEIYGTPGMPITWGDLENKFRDCGRMVISEEKLGEVVEAVKNLEQITNIREITQLLC